MQRSQLAFLQGAAGETLLGIVEAEYDESSPLELAGRLRRRYPPDQVAAAMTQVELRRRATAKFGDRARRMFFTPDGLEQATHAIVAAHRARRLCAGEGLRLIDLGCGIGSDLIAAAARGMTAYGVDSDPVTAAVAEANLAALDLPGSVAVGSAEDADLGAYDRFFADPARRGPRGRIFDPEGFSPPWTFVRDAILQPGTAVRRAGAVKTAPGIPDDLVPPGVEAEFVSLEGRLREACLWSPALALVGRRATVLSSSRSAVTVVDADVPGDPRVRAPGAYVYEPDDAVVRAHLVSVVVAAVDGWLLDPHIGYVSSDRRTTTPLARGFEVLDVLPYRDRALRAALRRRGIGPLTVKKRGVAVPPETLVKRLALRGNEPGTLILSRTPRSAVALLVRPMTAEDDSAAGGEDALLG